ncbi:hypothetical protein [Collinsella ihumii]|uniref:Toxin-antitoxin system antitoxin subunit n=1 Tax=Collinsella ihumii TaxID=1720204 RepID=A0AAW7JTL7_9ACTN|nr:hypothetical protein [Collinsella ihumii]MDN0069722.1 hypothetical protein [Collinsella ihumii]
MAEYRLKDGYALTDKEIERLSEACERGNYPGEPGEWIVRPQGKPALSDEPLANVYVELPQSMVAAIDAKGGTCSDFIRKAVAAVL